MANVHVNELERKFIRNSEKKNKGTAIAIFHP